jgi:hypothetical protein
MLNGRKEKVNLLNGIKGFDLPTTFTTFTYISEVSSLL